MTKVEWEEKARFWRRRAGAYRDALERVAVMLRENVEDCAADNSDDYVNEADAFMLAEVTKALAYEDEAPAAPFTGPEPKEKP